MFYKDDSELYVQSTRSDGELNLRYVTPELKERTYRHINSRIENSKRNKNLLTHYKNAEIHMVAEIINRVPMYCNVIASRGYSNILFVGHFNASQYKWYLKTRPADPDTRLYHELPPERDGQENFVDLNICHQFVPIIWDMYGYKPNMDYVQPPHSRNLGMMHELYQKFELNRVRSDTQYRHGDTQFVLSDWDENPYDAVVFAGVPEAVGKDSFSMTDVVDSLSAYVTDDCEFIDLWGNQSHDYRFYGNEADRLPTDNNVATAFRIRGDWDKQVRNEGRPEEYALMCKNINAYRKSFILEP
jgi:hypothetical protein